MGNTFLCRVVWPLWFGMATFTRAFVFRLNCDDRYIYFVITQFRWMKFIYSSFHWNAKHSVVFLTYFVCNFSQSTHSDTTFLHWRGHSCNDPKNHFWEYKSSVSLHSLKEDHTILRDIFCVRRYSYTCNDQNYHCVTYIKCDTLASDN